MFKMIYFVLNYFWSSPCCMLSFVVGFELLFICVMYFAIDCAECDTDYQEEVGCRYCCSGKLPHHDLSYLFWLCTFCL